MVHYSVGPDHVPTFPSEPEPTKCEPKTASICSTTTSFVVSTIDGKTKTVSSKVGKPTCEKITGCHVSDSDRETSKTKTDECRKATVTDVVMTCTGKGKDDCSTKTKKTKTGCSKTLRATTTTVSCRPAASGKARRRGEDKGKEPEGCPISADWVVWPKDGRKKDETDAIYKKIKEVVGDADKIKVSDTKQLGVNYWLVTLETGQDVEIGRITNVSCQTHVGLGIWKNSLLNGP